MFFASDNAGPVHPKILDALVEVNQGYATAYGDDEVTARVVEQVRDVFEAPEAAVYFVAIGTAANSLILATLGEPWQTTFCTPMAHINVDECNAPEFYSGGAKLTLVPAVDAKMTPQALRKAIENEESRGVHGPQRGPISITQATENGTIYSVSEIEALSDVAKEFGLPLHMDGARFANALVSLNCSPAQMTWQAGVDALSFGVAKNGGMGVEAVVFFDPKHAWEFELRRKRGAHLFSKHRFVSAQVGAYLNDGLWLDCARAANGNAARLEAGLKAAGAEVVYERQANLLFFRMKRSEHKRLQDAGAQYYLWDGDLSGDPEAVITGRLVCDWSIPEVEIDRFLAILSA